MAIKHNSFSATAIGKIAEVRAYQYLKSQGLVLVGKNFYTSFGEIDLIMLDSDVLVFIEVRYRSGNKLIQAIESVDQKKQNKIIRSAEVYLSKHSQFQSCFIRFDVISFDNGLAKPCWIQSAFEG